jgi:hypothetical protein
MNPNNPAYWSGRGAARPPGASPVLACHGASEAFVHDVVVAHSAWKAVVFDQGVAPADLDLFLLLNYLPKNGDNDRRQRS